MQTITLENLNKETLHISLAHIVYTKRMGKPIVQNGVTLTPVEITVSTGDRPRANVTDAQLQILVGQS